MNPRLPLKHNPLILLQPDQLWSSVLPVCNKRKESADSSIRTYTNTTKQIDTRQTSRCVTFDMASGLPKSLPPCSRKPHGPPPLSEAVYVVPAISQYLETGSKYCIYKTPTRLMYKHHSTQLTQPSRGWSDILIGS